MEENLQDFTMTVKGQDYAEGRLNDFLTHLPMLEQAEYAEVWLHRGNEMTSLLTNRPKSRAFLMYLTSENVTGFHAFSPDQAASHEEIKFEMKNGQDDKFVLGDTVSMADGIRAMIDFYRNGGMASFLQWQNDSKV